MTDYPKRDRWGRPLMPDPITGEERAWTRATTWANTLSDPWGLVDWKLRSAVKGVGMRRDLYALAASLPLVAGKKQLNEVAQDAIEAAGGSSGRNLGTALHEWTAQVDRGEEPDIIEPWDRDVEAYTATLERYSVRTVPGLVERIVCVPELGVAGTFDRIVVWDPEAYIADVKTAAKLDFSWAEIAVQEALYARATHLWIPAENADGGSWEPMQPVNLEQGLVIHLPVGQAKCDLYWVDLQAGWEAAEFAGWVRNWRKRGNLSRPFGVDLLGRSPVHPVLDLGAGAREPDGESAAPADGDVPTLPAPEDSPAAETEGAGADTGSPGTVAVGESLAPAGGSDG